MKEEREAGKQFKVLEEGDPGYPEGGIKPPVEETQVEKNNRFIWDALRRPPKEALKEITGGRLKGMTDINPQWRYEAATEQFGPCGTGWKYEIKRLWTEPGSDGQVFAFAEINLYYKIACVTNSPLPDDVWSEPIPGLGGSMLVAKEKAGLHSNDEAFKMAITDALSTSLKMLGVAADIYRGMWDGTTFWEEPEYINDTQFADIHTLIKDTASDEKKFCAYLKIESIDKLPASRYKTAIKALEGKK
jgi:hypothetical protein